MHRALYEAYMTGPHVLYADLGVRISCATSFDIHMHDGIKWKEAAAERKHSATTQSFAKADSSEDKSSALLRALLDAKRAKLNLVSGTINDSSDAQQARAVNMQR